MTQSLYARISQRLKAGWYWCISFRKRDWDLSDYPVRLRRQETEPQPRSPRYKSHHYVAQVINWWAICGTGNTKEEAMRDLAANFANVRANRRDTGTPLPRPGKTEPIEFVSGERVYAHPELTDDFIRRVLDLSWAFLSDESSLWDFHHEETNDAYFAKIKEVYGVEVSDIKSGKLCDIFERIAATTGACRSSTIPQS